jgi:hypothetical protein
LFLTYIRHPKIYYLTVNKLGLKQMAGKVTGTITKYRLDKNIQGRGVCIQMNPALTEGQGWACVWKDSPIGQETTDLLLNLYSGNKPCTIQWSVLRGGHIEIDVVESP